MKAVKKLLCCIFVICTMTSTFCQAAVTQSDYLDAYRGVLTAKSYGRIVITVDVEAIVDATEVGASQIDLYESTDGVHFTRIMQFFPEDYPLMMGSGYDHYKDAVTYYGVPGRYYCANVYCYAADNTGSDTRIYETSTVQAISG